MTINTNPATVNARSRKDVMYGEIERLRALLDAQDSQLAMQAETIERLQTRVENAKRVYLEQRAQIEERCRCIDCDGDRDEHDPWCPAMREQFAPDDALRVDLNTIAKRCATLLKRSTQVRGGRVEQYKDGEWIAVPQRVVKFANS